MLALRVARCAAGNPAPTQTRCWRRGVVARPLAAPHAARDRGQLVEAEQEGWRGEAAPAAAGRRQRRSAEADVAVAQRQFPGAIATMVLGAALLSERLDGCGFVQQLELHDAKHMHPLLMVVATALGAVAVWPRRRLEHEDSIDLVQEFAGRAAFAGLGAAIAAELSTGKGLLRLLEVETGVEALSEVEAVLAFLVCLILTRPHSRAL